MATARRVRGLVGCVLLSLFLQLSWSHYPKVLADGGIYEIPPLIDATVESLSVGLQRKQFTSVDLVKTYIARISEVNDTVHAVTEINPDALYIASQLDAERRHGSVRGPLHGIPILIKGNIATLDGMETTAGSWAMFGVKVAADATVAEKLRKAGAIILGKTNLSQWANFRSAWSNSSNGWSALGGQVYAVYHSKQDPSGSSSGSGVASDLALALACLGTETDGSIVFPSSRNNIVGIKPTVGLTSRNGVIPISEHQDTIGPMARTVKDAAYILQAIAGPDVADNYTAAIPNDGAILDYVAACNPSALQGARIGIPRNVISLSGKNDTLPETLAFEAAISVMKDAGAAIVDGTNFPAAAEFMNSTSEFEVLNADFITNLASFLATLTHNPNNITTLSGLRSWTQASPLESYPDRNTEIWDNILDRQGWNNTDPRFWDSYQKNLYFGGEGGLLGTLEKYDLDAVILPTSFASSWGAIVGAPIITVPLGVYPEDSEVVMNQRESLVSTGPGVPFGISFLGAKWSEAKLIGLAYAFEQKTTARRMGKQMVTPSTEITHALRRGDAYGLALGSRALTDIEP